MPSSVSHAMGLQQFERRLERMVEGAFAKAFRGELQPIEIGRRLTREMDLRRSVSVRGIVAPNAFVVFLADEDYQRFSTFQEALVKELTELAREHARNEGYTLLGPISVGLDADRKLVRSTFEISAEVDDSAEAVAGYLVLPDGRRIGVTSEPVTIGRLPDCVVALSDPNVSRHHAEVRREGGEVTVTDLGSTNGTRVNGAPVHHRQLSDGDVVTIGRTALRFEGT
jgi:hypothetical protein